jgi:hypothetical protein
MLLHKTEQARAALSDTKSGALSLHQRRILILTDGKRSINDLMAMLGNDILGDIDALMRAGYLTTGDAPAARAAAGAGLGQRLREAASRMRPTGAETGPVTAPSDIDRAGTPAASSKASPAASSIPAAPAVTPAAAPTASRRSLAASKMYVMDLLQMQRDLGIAECRTEIQCAQDETATVVALLDGVRHLIPLVSIGMAGRILARLDEVLPEPYLPALRALQSELTGKPVLAITNAA